MRPRDTSQLKRDLAQRHRSDREAYTRAKDAYVAAVVEVARKDRAPDASPLALLPRTPLLPVQALARQAADLLQVEDRPHLLDLEADLIGDRQALLERVELEHQSLLLDGRKMARSAMPG